MTDNDTGLEQPDISEEKSAFSAMLNARLLGPHLSKYRKAGFGAGDNPDEDPTERVLKRQRAAFMNAAQEEPKDVLAQVKPGFYSEPPSSSSPLGMSPKANTDAGDTGLRGEGWIYCGKDARGRPTWIKDKGDSIYIPYNRFDGMSDGQRIKVAEIARQRGWEQVGVFKSGGISRDIRAMHQLMPAGLPCAMPSWNAPWLGTCRDNARDLHTHSMREQVAQRAAQEAQMRVHQELAETREKLAQALKTNPMVPV